MADDLHTLVVGREAMACRFEVAFNAGEIPEATARAAKRLYAQQRARLLEVAVEALAEP